MPTLKHNCIIWFIPHKHNGFRPRILEVESLGVIVAILVALKILSIISYSHSLGADIFNQLTQSDLYTLTNEARASNGEPALQVNPVLEEAAQLKLQDMITNGYFAHVSPQGATPWIWFDKAHYSYQIAGENLAMDFSSSNDVMQAWLKSELHRKNILLPDFTDIGIATGVGVINGQKQTIVVQEFGKPVAAVVVTKAAPKASTPVSSVAPKQTVAKTPIATVRPRVVSKATTSPTAQPSPTVLARTESQAIHFAGETTPKVTVLPQPVVKGAAETSPSTEITYISWSMIQLIFVLVFLASLAILMINIFRKIHFQFPTLLARSIALAMIAIIVLTTRDSAFLIHHVILPQ